jgi:hypothetical protein
MSMKRGNFKVHPLKISPDIVKQPYTHDQVGIYYPDISPLNWRKYPCQGEDVELILSHLGDITREKHSQVIPISHNIDRDL